MYINVWEMYGNNNSIKFYKLMQQLDLNLMYTHVVELEELYLFAIKHFQIHALVSRKLTNKNFTIENV